MGCEKDPRGAVETRYLSEHENHPEELQAFRRRGKIRKSLTWKKFLETQMQFIHAMDFVTVDTMPGKRFYVFAVICHKTREIVQFAITELPPGNLCGSS